MNNRSERDLLSCEVVKLLHNCEDLFHFYSLSTVHSYDLYRKQFTSFSSFNEYKSNSHLTCLRRGFIAQSVEHRTGIAEVMGSNPVGYFFPRFICNCLSCFTTAKISLTSILSAVHSYDLYHINFTSIFSIRHSICAR